MFRNPTYTRYQIHNTTGPLFALEHSRTQPAPRWTTLLSPPKPGWVQWFWRQLDALGSDYIACSDTVGSYDTSATLKAYFHQLSPNGRASAALIIKNTTKHWRRRPMLVMYISDGRAIGATYVYTMEYLALAATLYLSAVTLTMHATSYDAKSVLKNIPVRR